MQMTSEQIQQLCLDFIGGKFSDDELESFRQHMLALDQTTAADLSKYSKVASALLFAAGPVAPSFSLKDKIMGQVRQEAHGPQAVPGKTIPQFTFIHSHEGEWQTMADGITAKVLYQDPVRKFNSLLVRLAPGASFPGHLHEGTEELFVIEGECVCHGRRLCVGDYHRAESGSDHGTTSTENGCLMFVIQPGIAVHS